ncbi:MAG TPA: tyrosine-type recombinase/integrase [Solirubrobacterales bacterium]|nr:tyrosine-type recombinase/integrase [Solirubrobacterales bacterium]
MSVHKIKPRKGSRKPRYEVRYREGDRNRSKVFDLKDDADAFDGNVRVSRQRGAKIVRANDTPYLRDHAADWMRRRKQSGTIAPATLKRDASIFDNHVDPYLGGLRVGAITVPRLDEWQGELFDAGASGEVVKRSGGVLSQILGDAKRRGHVEANAASDLDRVAHTRQKGRAADPEQVEAMRSHFLAADDLEGAALVSVFGYVGLRPEEARVVGWNDLDGRRFVLAEDQTKDKTPEREAEIPDPVLADLKRWRLRSGRPAGGLIFPGIEAEHDYRNWRKRKFRPAAGAAGLLVWDEDAEKWSGRFRPYDLRHTSVSLMIRANTPITEIAAHHGHGPATLLKVYAHDLRRQRGKPAIPVGEAIEAARSGRPSSVDVRREGDATPSQRVRSRL